MVALPVWSVSSGEYWGMLVRVIGKAGGTVGVAYEF